MENGDISYNCPSCNSENIQKASVLVSLGSKKLRATTIGIGGGSSGINAQCWHWVKWWFNNFGIGRQT